MTVTLSNITPVNNLSIKKEKKSSDLVIEKSFELYGFTPDEKSDENLKWMLKQGYLVKRIQRNKRRRGRR